MMNRLQRLALVPTALLLELAASPAAALTPADCTPDRPLIAYTSTPPLLASQPDSSLQVTVYRNGCVKAHFPGQDVRHGTYTAVLGGTELKRLATEIEQSRITEVDPRQLSAAAAQRKQKARAEGGEFFAVRDENILQIRVFDRDSKSSAHTVRWASLTEDLLHWPDSTDLLAIAAVQMAMEQLGNAVHDATEARR